MLPGIREHQFYAPKGIERTDQGAGVVKHRLKRKPPAMVHTAAARGRQINEPSTMELEQHRAAGHVFDPSALIALIPPRTDLAGEPGAMPLGVSLDELANQSEFRFAQISPLQPENLLHACEDAEPNFVSSA